MLLRQKLILNRTALATRAALCFIPSRRAATVERREAYRCSSDAVNARIDGCCAQPAPIERPCGVVARRNAASFSGNCDCNCDDNDDDDDNGDVKFVVIVTRRVAIIIIIIIIVIK